MAEEQKRKRPPSGSKAKARPQRRRKRRRGSVLARWLVDTVDKIQASRPEFQPDKQQSSLSQLLHFTKQQRMSLLRWVLLVLTCVLCLVAQDCVMSRIRLFGATTDLGVAAILLVGMLEGTETGSIFALLASIVYYFSGSAPGPYCIGLLCAVGIIATLLRQAYLRRTKASIVICAGIALTIYEMGLFVVGIGLGLTRWDRVFSFLITAGYSFGVMVLLYPLINRIGLIGGTTWKE